MMELASFAFSFEMNASKDEPKSETLTLCFQPVSRAAT